jgi:ankyrin repeat protein
MFALAAYNKAKDCAKLLVEYCRPNDLIIGDRRHWGIIPDDTVFSRFLSEMCEEYDSKANGSHDDCSSECLDIFKMVLQGMLQSGADVDAFFPTSAGEEKLYLDCNVPPSLKPTYLDVCFYLHTEIFNQVLPYSHKHNVHLTRDGVCTGALQSKEALSTYLDRLSTTSNIDSQAYLRATLIDQFSHFGIFPIVYMRRLHGVNGHIARALIDGFSLFPTLYMRRLHGVGGRIAQALIEYGVQLTPNPGLGVLQKFLQRVVESAAQYGFSDSLAFLTAHLVGQGAVVSSDILAVCLGQRTATLFTSLIQSGAEISQFGQEALRVAAEAGNYEAVCLLLTIGVDINATVKHRPGRTQVDSSMTVLAILLTDPKGEVAEETRRSMWQFLIRNGAKLRLCPQDTTCYRLLEKIMRFGNCRWSALNYMLQFEEEMNQIAPSQWMDLFLLSLERAAQLSIKKSSSAAHRITEIADVLLRRCGGRVSQPVLAVAIAAGCQQRLINDLIKSGQSIKEPSGGMTPLQAASSEHDYELVSTLLHLGADINAPACSEYGADALQFACKWRYSSNWRVEQMRLQSRLVKLLLAKGADVNAPANGETALQLICKWNCRNREEADHHRNLVTFLLENGANANSGSDICEQTALQLCAEKGDLETTSLLIQYGADPNGHPLPAGRRAREFPFSALDFSAMSGRLDMTQYLLNIGALSASPGASGFEGAIKMARRNGHHAVREIILKHVEKISQQHRENRIMQQAHEESIQRHAATLKERQDWYDSMK